MTGRSAVQRTRLPNGIRILTERTPHHKGAVALFRFAAGSAYEAPAGWGTAHFLEHMVFQGTPDKNHDTLMMELARLGAVANASTGFESTVYDLTAPASTMLQALEIMAEMLSRFALDEQAVERERDIILEEWRMTRDDPAAWGEDCLYHQVLGDFGHPILGTEETIAAIGRGDLREFAESYYTPENLIVAVAGNLEHERVVEVLARWFGADKRLSKPKPPVRIARSPRLHIDEEHEQEQIFIGFQAPPLSDGKLPAFDVLTSILGGDSWSRLFRKIRNELGLAYSIGGFYSGWQEIGLYGIQSATHPDNAGRLLDEIRREVAAIRHDVTADEIELAKATLRANLLFGVDQLSWRAERLLVDEAVFGRIRPVEEDLRAIANVSRDDVTELAQTVLDLDKSTLVTVGRVPLD
ncbi:M16 family metallopeptidase [Effusibacillus pohliae]|uniref:M16 family metallopeptidase n=1 Tax=Effusibacillus pohliae TaxID=232270 RepID=UPI00036A752D|nr:pitrilysin family protein [Effusibacillus pohliae]